ncbi:hypothetical protein HanIR_Chr13g0658381 [Helianthus annuus]|nr:hypothetical protein HanIR_Chr13g0658381 [Helianthus annuus]
MSNDVDASFWSLSSNMICRKSFLPSSSAASSVFLEFVSILSSIMWSKILSRCSRCFCISLFLPCKSNHDNIGIKSEIFGAVSNAIILNSTSRNPSKKSPEMLLRPHSMLVTTLSSVSKAISLISTGVPILA